jgi:large subunit ribosomal protein L23
MAKNTTHEGHDHAHDGKGGEKKVAPLGLILKPRITEKASNAQAGEKAVYVFEVLPKATKITLAAEIKKTYKVTPAKIHITNLPAKRVFVRGKWGKKSSLKKALVYLKKGDKLDLAA